MRFIILNIFALEVGSFSQYRTTGAIYNTHQPRMILPEKSCVEDGAMPVSHKKGKKKLFSFKEARRLSRGHGFSSKQEFDSYECAGAYQLPKNIDELYPEFNGWDDFLGIPLNFDEARSCVKRLGLANEESYIKIIRSLQDEDRDNEMASRLPFRPDLKYKNDWISWDHFLNE